MYKKLVRMMLDAKSKTELTFVCGEIDTAFGVGKITFKDHEELFELLNRLWETV